MGILRSAGGTGWLWKALYGVLFVVNQLESMVISPALLGEKWACTRWGSFLF